MKLMQFGVLRNEFEDGLDGGGGAIDAENLDDSNSVLDEGGGQDLNTTQQDPKGGAAPQPDWNQIGEAMARTMAQAQPQQRQAPPQMSKEEFRRVSQYYAVTPEQAAALFNADTPVEKRVEMLQQMIDGAATHSIAVARMLQQQQAQEIQGQLTPVQQMIMKSHEDRFLGDVVNEYPQLKSMDQASRLAINLMRQNGYRHTSDAQTKKDFLTTLQSVVSMAGGKLSLQRAQQTNTRRTMPQMAGSVNGSGQSGGGAGGQTRKPAWMSALD